MKLQHHFVKQIKLADLAPTQMAIGYLEVHAKQEEWNDLPEQERRQQMDKHWFPAVIGPGKRYYIVDHHHTAMALMKVGEKNALVIAKHDWSHLDPAIFWKAMEFRHFAHPYDAKGRRAPFDKMPKYVSDLLDDPFRGLVSMAQKAGALASELPPLGEFLWADYFRHHISPKELRQGGEQAAVVRALELAKLQQAKYLPGWAGNSDY